MATEFLSLQRPFSLTHKMYRNPLPRVIQATPLTLKLRCSVSTKNVSLTEKEPETETRRSANYEPNSWDYDYLLSSDTDDAIEVYKDKAKKLDAEVRSKINNETAEFLTQLELIDTIQRLGLGYRFESDIRRALDRYVSSGGLEAVAKTSLQATALSFRLLRQHGFEVSQEVFNGFKDQNGNFMENLKEDIKAILSLYEASFLALEGENILDEAKVFTISHLKELNEEKIGKDLVEQVNHALELPLHRRTQRLEAVWSIEAYQLAILDYNMVQSVYQRDLRETSRWWRRVGLATKLHFARDRLIESFYWAVGVAFEPQYSDCRISVAKMFSFVTIIDDIYDVYGTLDELELFTDAVERWDVSAIDDLPDYMKLCFLALYNTINEIAYDNLKEKGENILPYLTKAWADLCNAFLQEAKFLYNKSTPTFDDYFGNAWKSSSGPLQLVFAYFAVVQNIKKEETENLQKYHDIISWPSYIFRLCNDLASASAEIARGETANSVSCYMRTKGISEELATESVMNLIDETWKKMNKEKLGDSLFAKHFVETAINLARQSHCTYHNGDAHTSPDELTRKRVLSVITEPILSLER
ncbi:isoprene synthase [Salix suchowensis]|nr:isoprene synthase [Salix suchowensis]